MVSWRRPPSGVCKINVYGFSEESRRVSYVGCVSRTPTGYCIGSYYGQINYEPRLATELTAILYGLKLAHEECYRSIEVESDSEQAVYHSLNPDPMFESRDLVDQIRILINKPWESCVLRHIPISSNQVAIRLALHGEVDGNPIRRLHSYPSEIFPTIVQDWLDSE